MINYSEFTKITDIGYLHKNYMEDFTVERQSDYEEYQRHIIGEYGPHGFPYEGADPYEIECKHNHKFKFLEVSFDDGDIVALFFKVYSMYGHNGSYIWFKPISKKFNNNNEQLVLKHLVDNNMLTTIKVPDVLSSIDYTKLELFSDDYYTFVQDRFAEVQRSKYRSSKGVNKLSNYGINFQINNFDPDEIHNLSYYWWKLHGKQDLKFDKSMQEFIDKAYKGQVDILTWTLNDQLMGFTIIAYYFDNTSARIIHNRNLLKTEIDSTDSFVKAHLADYMHYHTIKYLASKDVSYVYIGSAVRQGKFLAPYKARNFNRKINVYSLPAEDWKLLYAKEES